MRKHAWISLILCPSLLWTILGCLSHSRHGFKLEEITMRLNAVYRCLLLLQHSWLGTIWYLRPMSKIFIHRLASWNIHPCMVSSTSPRHLLCSPSFWTMQKWNVTLFFRTTPSSDAGWTGLTTDIAIIPSFSLFLDSLTVCTFRNGAECIGRPSVFCSSSKCYTDLIRLRRS